MVAAAGRFAADAVGKVLWREKGAFLLCVLFTLSLSVFHTHTRTHPPGRCPSPSRTARAGGGSTPFACACACACVCGRRQATATTPLVWLACCATRVRACWLPRCLAEKKKNKEECFFFRRHSFDNQNSFSNPVATLLPPLPPMAQPPQNLPPALVPALAALYGGGGASGPASPGDEHARRAAEAWLVDFQKSDTAWQVGERERVVM